MIPSPSRTMPTITHRNDLAAKIYPPAHRIGRTWERPNARPGMDFTRALQLERIVDVGADECDQLPLAGRTSGCPNLREARRSQMLRLHRRKLSTTTSSRMSGATDEAPGRALPCDSERPAGQ